MSSTLAALPPPTQHIPHEPEYDGAPDVPEIAFNELWQDKEGGLSFGDFIDIINPLHHIPVVSTIYRMATDDEIGVGSRVLGGTLFGGPLGLLGAGLTAIFEEVSGGSVEEHVASLWNAITDDGETTSQVAATESKGAPQATPLRLEDDYASAQQLPMPGNPGQRAGEQIAAATTVSSHHTATPTPPSPQQVSQASPITAPITAIHRVNHPETQPAATDGGADRQRINRAIDQAQRAQAGLLLANLGVDSVDQPSETDAQTTNEQYQPFKPHPYMLPRGAPPALINQAMEQALAKYQATLQRRSAAATTASPLPTSAVIR